MSALRLFGGAVQQMIDGMQPPEPREREKERTVTPTLLLTQVFITVAMHEGSTVSELANRVGLPVSSISRQLFDLGMRNRKHELGFGLIEQYSDRDLRVKRYRLTPKGHALVAKVGSVLTSTMRTAA